MTVVPAVFQNMQSVLLASELNNSKQNLLRNITPDERERFEQRIQKFTPFLIKAQNQELTEEDLSTITDLFCDVEETELTADESMEANTRYESITSNERVQLKYGKLN